MKIKFTKNLNAFFTWFLKIGNSIILIILSIWGLNGCDTKCEYGTPYADYKVKGKITSETDQPIKGIQTIMLDHDTALSDNDGNYNLSTRSSFLDTVKLRFVDPDNFYQEKDTFVSFKEAKFIGGDDDWYEGKATKETNVKMKTKDAGK